MAPPSPLSRPPIFPIVGQNGGLRGTSDFLGALDRSREPQPRALRALAQIVDGGLCHRCGSCIGICPTQVLGLDGEAYPRVDNLSACTDCDLCVRVCPGEQFPVEETHRELFGTPYNLTDTHGSFVEGAVGYASDCEIRKGSTSGGIVTGLLASMLDRGEIDGAIIVAHDHETLWKGRVMIARSRAELLGGMKSKYAIAPTNVALQEVREVPGRYALVGLPCQIHGLRKAQALDDRIRERVVLAIGLFCHAAIEHEAFRVLWESLGPLAPRVRRFVSRVGKHPGTPHVELDDGSLVPFYFPKAKGYRPSSIEVINILYRLYTPERCTTCFDALGDFADLSVGDPWMAPPADSVDFRDGYSFTLIRTERGRRAYAEAVARGALSSLTVRDDEARRCNALMAPEKRWRAFRVIETHRRQGKPVPDYGLVHGFVDDHLPQHSGLEFLKTELHMVSHLFCFLPTVRAQVLRFFMGPIGYRLFWLNNFRRRFREWRRDTFALVRRRLRGVRA